MKTRVKGTITLSLLILAMVSASCSTAPLRGRTVDNFYCRTLHLPLERPAEIPARPMIGFIMEPVRKKVPAFPDCRTFVRVYEVFRGSPAAEAGIRKGDIIISLDGLPLCGMDRSVTEEVRNRFKGLPPQGSVTIGIMRAGTVTEKVLRLRPWPLWDMDDRIGPEPLICPAGEKSRAFSLLSEGTRIEEDQDLLRRYEEIWEDLLWGGLSYYRPLSDSSPLPPPPLLKRAFLSPMDSAWLAERLVERVISPVNPDDWNLHEMLREAYRLTGIDLPPAGRCPDPDPHGIMKRSLEAADRISSVLESIGEPERNFLWNNSVLPWEKEGWERFTELAPQIPIQELARSAVPLLTCLNSRSIKNLKKRLQDYIRTAPELPVTKDTPYGKFIIGSPGDDIYREDALVIIEPGGNDTYMNNAGATRPGIPLSLVIDLGGSDTYLSSKDYSQGAGLLGTGILIDLGGEDHFISGRAGQGTGVFGTGVVLNTGGKTWFSGLEMTQGTGLFGLGMLISMDEKTYYRGAAYGQGLGLPGGGGLLIDRGGDDEYLLGGKHPDFRDPEHSTISIGQGYGKGFRPSGSGTGLSGGTGILIDLSGDDLYHGDYFSQGGGYFLGIGILSDLRGNDTYITGRYSLGAGVHRAAGILIDHSGNDFYLSTYGVSEGMGHDYALGMLIDRNGNDRYEGGILTMGAATNSSIGILMDPSGRNTFRYGKESSGYAQHKSSLGLIIRWGLDEKAIQSKKTL
jgi:hypothetical protein